MMPATAVDIRIGCKQRTVKAVQIDSCGIGYIKEQVACLFVISQMMSVYYNTVHSKVEGCAAVTLAACYINKYSWTFRYVDIERITTVTCHPVPRIHIYREDIYTLFITVKCNISVCAVVNAVCLKACKVSWRWTQVTECICKVELTFIAVYTADNSLVVWVTVIVADVICPYVTVVGTEIAYCSANDKRSISVRVVSVCIFIIYIIPTGTCEVTACCNTSATVSAGNVAVALCEQSKACRIAEYVIIDISDKIVIYRRLGARYRNIEIFRW